MNRMSKVAYEKGANEALDSFGVKEALLPLAGLVAPIAGMGARMLGSAALRGMASKAAPMVMNAVRTNGVNAALQGGMNALQAGPGVGNKLKAGIAGGATGLVGGPGVKGMAVGMGAQMALPSINNAIGVT